MTSKEAKILIERFDDISKCFELVGDKLKEVGDRIELIESELAQLNREPRFKIKKRNDN